MDESETTQEIDDLTLEDLYSWVDSIPFTRPKKDIKRDFADGVLIAEIVHAFVPSVVEIHNYVPAHKYDGKVTNWKLLNRKVFKKLGFQIADDVISNICGLKPLSVELFLLLLRRKIENYMFEKNREKERGDMNDQPESDQINLPAAPQNNAVSGRPRPMKKMSSTGTLSIPESLLSLGSGQSGSTQPRNRNTVVQQQGRTPASTKSQPGMVTKIEVEEKEQEILAKEETIQILTAKVRRLEHLLHLKDVRLDDLQGKFDQLEAQVRPTAQRAVRR